jgi:3-hydroxyacyl-CoA dehydrogenase/enoyl-CoA hydratase/3-hydroxybutyryl-CoA epimerase
MKQYQYLTLNHDEHHYLWVQVKVHPTLGNEISSTLLDELMSACAYASQDTDLKLIIITSAHSHSFLDSIQVEQLQALRHRQTALKFIQQAQELTALWQRLTIPVIALVNGSCTGLGLELALGCDAIIVPTQVPVTFQHNDLALGIVPSTGQFPRLIRRAGAKAAWTFILSGQIWNSTKAQAHGLIDYLTPPEGLTGVLAKLAKTRKSTLIHKQRRHQHWSNTFKWTQSLGLKQLIDKYYSPKFYPAPRRLLSNWQQYPAYSKDSLNQEAHTFADLLLEAPSAHLIYLKQAEHRLQKQIPEALHTLPSITIIGTEQIGQKLALACLLKGCSVTIRESNSDKRANAETYLRQQLATQLPTETLSTTLEKLLWTKHLNNLSTDFVIECISDQLRAKQELLAELEESTSEHTILITTSLCHTLKDLTAPLLQPQRVVGLHSFSPFKDQSLVEIIHLPQRTLPEAIERALGLMRLISKLPLLLKDQSSFAIYRILIMYLVQGMRLQQQGVPVTTVDQAAREFGMRYGPLELADHIGLDVCLQLGELAKQQLGLEIPASLRTMVAHMKLGRKTQNGFYRYRHDRALKTEREQWTGNIEQMKRKLVKPMIEEAHLCLELGLIEDAGILDLSVVNGCGFPAFRGGPIRYATHPLSES